jgi:hypothetical protein
MRVSITFYPNSSKKSARTGKTPIYARFLLNTQKAEIRLNAEVSETEILKWDPMTMRLKDRNHFVNRILNNLATRFEEFRTTNATTLNRYNVKTFRDKIMGNDQLENPGLIQYLDGYFQNAVARNKERAPGTIRNYTKAINHIKAFVEFKKQKHMLVTDVDNKWVNELKDFLLSDNAELNRKGMTEVSASGIFKKFKTIFDRAVIEGLIERNAFKSVKLKNRSPQRQPINQGYLPQRS